MFEPFSCSSLDPLSWRRFDTPAEAMNVPLDVKVWMVLPPDVVFVPPDANIEPVGYERTTTPEPPFAPAVIGDMLPPPPPPPSPFAPAVGALAPPPAPPPP
jgi:hypothetical protein